MSELGLALCAESAGFAGAVRWEEAERCFMSVINQGYEDAEVVTGRALAMMRQEREEDARRFYHQAARHIKELPASLIEAIHRFLPGQEVIGDITHSSGHHDHFNQWMISLIVHLISIFLDNLLFVYPVLFLSR